MCHDCEKAELLVKNKAVIISLLLLFELLTVHSRSQIFAVRTEETSWEGLFQVRQATSDGKMRVLTGFRVEGRVGLFTCLHGVIEAAIDPEHHPIIATRGANQNNKGVSMRVISVDLKEDLAFLSPVEQTTWKEVTEAGHPYSFVPIENAENSLRVGDTVFLEGNPAASGFVQTKEGRVIGSSNYALNGYSKIDALKGLVLRGSPALRLTIIPLQASVTNGESGSPLLNAQRQLLGVVDGGLSEGQNWAIPVQKSTFDSNNPDFISPRDVATVKELTRISNQDVKGLTSLDRESDSSCQDALSNTGYISGATDLQLANCIRQSLRANQAGGYHTLSLGSSSQFYLWIKLPEGSAPPIQKACYNIASVQPTWISRVLKRGSDCPHHGISSCTVYRNAVSNPKLGLIPWVGEEWNPDLTVSISVTIAGRLVRLSDLPLKDIQFDELPVDTEDEC